MTTIHCKGILSPRLSTCIDRATYLIEASDQSDEDRSRSNSKVQKRYLYDKDLHLKIKHLNMKNAARRVRGILTGAASEGCF